MLTGSVGSGQAAERSESDFPRCDRAICSYRRRNEALARAVPAPVCVGIGCGSCCVAEGVLVGRRRGSQGDGEHRRQGIGAGDHRRRPRSLCPRLWRAQRAGRSAEDRHNHVRRVADEDGLRVHGSPAGREGKFALDTPLAAYLDNPLPEYDTEAIYPEKYGPYRDLAGDPRWKRITARHVLTHSTGFAQLLVG